MPTIQIADRSCLNPSITGEELSDCDEKTATMKNQACMPIAATLFKVLCTYPLVLEVCAACARSLRCSRCSHRRFVPLVLFAPEVCAARVGGLCCSCWKFVLLVLFALLAPEVCAPRAGGLNCSRRRFVLLVLEVVLYVLEVLKACTVCRSVYCRLC